MNQEKNEMQSRVQEQVEVIVTQGQDVRQQVADLVAEQAEGFQKRGYGLMDLSRSVMDGAMAAIDKAVPKDADSTLRQVVDGLGDGLEKAALAAKLAMEESQASARAFAAEDLDKLRKDLQTIGKMFVETVTTTGSKMRSEVANQFANLRQHAEKTQERVMPGIQSALTAVAQHPVQFGKETVGAGLNLSRQAVGALFSSMGRLMQNAGERISGRKSDGE